MKVLKPEGFKTPFNWHTSLPRQSYNRHNATGRIWGFPMTVAIGFQNEEFVLLCADSEISYGSSGKAQECKIHILSDRSSQIECACVYAGDVHYMEQVLPSLERVCRTNPTKLLKRLERECDSIFCKSQKRERRGVEFPYVQLLFAIGLQSGPKLYSSIWDIFKQKRSYEIIGIGRDVARSIIEPAYRTNPPLSRPETLMLAACGIKQASDYVQGCGKKIQCLVLDKSSGFLGGPYIDELTDFEKYFQFFREKSSKLMLSLSNVDEDDSTFDDELKLFCKQLKAFHSWEVEKETRLREEVSKTQED